MSAACPKPRKASGALRLSAHASASHCLQLGCSLFQHLASEFSSCDYGAAAVHEYFRPVAAVRAGKAQYVARSVLIDMEPKASA